MTAVKQLIEFAVYPLAMGVAAALCLWVLLGPLGVDRLPLAGQVTVAMPDLPPAPAPEGPVAAISESGAAVTAEPSAASVDPSAGISEPVGRLAPAHARVVSTIEDLPIEAGDSGALVTQMQGALIEKGYWVGPAGADGKFDEDTQAALGAFQDNNALPVQPACDRRCWITLGLTRGE